MLQSNMFYIQCGINYINATPANRSIIYEKFLQENALETPKDQLHTYVLFVRGLEVEQLLRPETVELLSKMNKREKNNS